VAYGPTTLFTNTSSGYRLTRSRRHLRLEGPPIVALSTQPRGQGLFEQFDRRQVVGRGDLMLVDLTAPYDFTSLGDGSAAALQVPHDVLGLPRDVVRVGSGRLPASPLYTIMRDHLAHFRRSADVLAADPGAAVLGTASVGLLRALITSASGVDAHARAAMADVLAQRVLAYARTHLTEPDLTPERIAAAHGVSVRALYRACSDAGIRLEQWIIEQRLEGARRTLSSAGGRTRAIGAVAAAWGFTDAGHFTRRFRGAYGILPRDWQRASATADPEGDRPSEGL